MHINPIVQEILSEEAVELLDTLAAHALVAAPAHKAGGACCIPLEDDNWNATLLLVHEIFDAEILISGDDEWISFRILESFGVKEGQLLYQFTAAFAQALS